MVSHSNNNFNISMTTPLFPIVFYSSDTLLLFNLLGLVIREGRDHPGLILRLQALIHHHGSCGRELLHAHYPEMYSTKTLIRVHSVFSRACLFTSRETYLLTIACLCGCMVECLWIASDIILDTSQNQALKDITNS